jgi:hypothetical protein
MVVVCCVLSAEPEMFAALLATLACVREQLARQFKKIAG